MKKLALIFLISLVAFTNVVFDVDAAVSVKGYYKKNGTYVQPHYRSNPDGSPYNNWSFPGNVNPYTGKVAPGNPDTYLNNYYGGASNSYGGLSGSGYTSNIKDVTGGYLIGSILYCNSGYYKQGDVCKQPPPNSTAYGGISFYCTIF